MLFYWIVHFVHPLVFTRDCLTASPSALGSSPRMTGEKAGRIWQERYGDDMKKTGWRPNPFFVFSSRLTRVEFDNQIRFHLSCIRNVSQFRNTGGYQDDGLCEGDCTGTVDWSDLRNKIGDTNVRYWTTDAVSCDFNTWECTSGTNNNSCIAFNVNLSSGAVTNNYRNNTYYALCE